MNTEQLLQRFRLGEDSALELQQVSIAMTIENMTSVASPCNEVIANLLARYHAVEVLLVGKRQLIDRRAAGVRMILGHVESRSGERPVYENPDNTELRLTIFAARPPNTKERRA